jgi:hypothetical protein
VRPKQPEVLDSHMADILMGEAAAVRQSGGGADTPMLDQKMPRLSRACSLSIKTLILTS